MTIGKKENEILRHLWPINLRRKARADVSYEVVWVVWFQTEMSLEVNREYEGNKYIVNQLDQLE